MQRSTDDTTKHCFRAERVFLSNAQYHFATREGLDQGPYANANDTEKALGHYVRTQHTMQRVRGRSPIDNGDVFDQKGVANFSKDIRAWRHAREQRKD
jgi:hypothetical protein